MNKRPFAPATAIESTIRLLFDYRGATGRRGFFLGELARGAGLAACYVLYQEGWFVIAAALVPVAIWPGVVVTIKRFRDLGHDPVLILPVLVYLSTGFAMGYRYDVPAIGVVALGIYLMYVGGVDGRPEAFTAEDHPPDS